MKTTHIFTILSACLLLTAAPLGATTFFVDQKSGSASDSGIGTEQQPFKTIRKALSVVRANDAVYIKKGAYNLKHFAAILPKSIQMIGEDWQHTVLSNGGGFTARGNLHVSGLTFTRFRSTVISIEASIANPIDELRIERCAFTHSSMVIRVSPNTRGTIKNVMISTCLFRDMEGTKVYAINLSHGILSNIEIIKNRFEKLQSNKKGCAAIVVGSNSTIDTTRNVLIEGNTVDGIQGPNTADAKGNGVEVHGIIAYGSGLKIQKNIVRDLNEGRDHEAIYIKGFESSITDNMIENCGSGSGGADISVKGGERSRNNEIARNIIRGSRKGRGMLIHGSAIIESNYISKPDGLNGIDVYAYGGRVEIVDNTVEISKKGIYLRDSINSVLMNNRVVSYEALPIKFHNSKNTTKDANQTCQGRNCPSQPYPVAIRIKPPVGLRIKLPVGLRTKPTEVYPLKSYDD
jgi:parallel beta-helix repeat protein